MQNLKMLDQNAPTFLLASAEPSLLTSVEPALARMGASVDIAMTARAALAAVQRTKPPDMVVLDSTLPDMEIEQLLAAIRAEREGLPILLIADAVTEEWMDRLAQGVIDDLILRNAETSYWEVRAERTMRARRLEYELDTLRETAARSAQYDRLTGVLNREALLSALFRETDRVQRGNGAFSVILFDVDDFGHWNSRLGANACDELLCQVTVRAARLLRSYDLLGRTGKDEFLIGLPACTTTNAMMLAERLRMEVFGEPYHVCGESIRLSACFGIAQSQGRSPIVVLREAEQVLSMAREMGPESIQCFGASEDAGRGPVKFLSPTSGEELLAW